MLEIGADQGRPSVQDAVHSLRVAMQLELGYLEWVDLPVAEVGRDAAAVLWANGLVKEAGCGM